MSDSQDKKDVELNEAFVRLEQQVEENNESARDDSPAAGDPAAGDPAAGDPAADVPVAAPPAEPSKSSPAPNSKGGGVSGILGILLALIALVVAIFGAYTAWQLQEQGQSSSAKQLNGVSGEIAALQNQLQNQFESQLQSQQQAFEQRFQSLQSELGLIANSAGDSVAEVESRVTSAMGRLKEQLGSSSEDWLLAEAEYLLRLANQRVVMEGDVAGAIALFESADQVINDAEGVIAFDLRQAIAHDIVALQAVSDVDIEGMFVRLGAVAGQIEALEQKHLKFTSDAPVVAVEAADQTIAAKALSLVERAVQRIMSQFDYRSNGDVIRPILPPQEEYYLKQNLLLKIQLAQLGLLKANQAIYEQSLKDAVLWIDQYFDAEMPLTISLRETLSQLSQATIERDIPDVSGSLREIRKLMARFHQAEEKGSS